jgi:hypothetical protein
MEDSAGAAAGMEKENSSGVERSFGHSLWEKIRVLMVIDS